METIVEFVSGMGFKNYPKEWVSWIYLFVLLDYENHQDESSGTESAII